MTAEQVGEHLRRLEIFGTFRAEWASEYYRVLKDSNYTWFVRAVDYLVGNYQGAKFPKPSDILRTIRELASKGAESAYKTNDGTYRDVEITRAWLAVFRRIPLIDNSVVRQEWLSKLNFYSPEWQDNPANKKELIAYFDGLLVQLKVLLGEKETEKKEMTPISEVPF